MQTKKSILGNAILYHPESSQRDIEDILLERFSDPSDLEKNISDLHDPYLLQDMDVAIKRIKEAKEKNQKVIIFGDYDVDGVTATSLLMHLFKTLEMQVSYRLPHRVHDGYGLKHKFIDELAAL